MRSRTGAVPHVRPLHLAVERYVRCPRGGLVRVERCAECDLMQGTLVGNGMEILCAYPEAAPALHLHPEGDPAATSRTASPGRPIPIAGPAGPQVEPDPDAPRPENGVTVRSTALIFENDWPDE